MTTQAVIVGAGSLVGQLLAREWTSCAGVSWVSRGGPRAWSVEQGPDALRPHLEDAHAIFCLAGAAGSGADVALNERIATAVAKAAPDGCHIFLASSQAVYGPYPGPHAEDGPVDPRGAYGESKLAMERAVLSLRDNVTALRMANVLGADMLGRNVAAGRAITMDRFPNGRTPLRTYVDVPGFAAILERLFTLAKRGASLPKVLNVGRAPTVEMSAIVDALGVGYQTKPAPDAALPEVSMDLSLLFEWVPEVSVPLDLRKALAQ